MDRVTRIITRKDIEAILTVREALPVVEAAFLSYGLGQFEMPPKVYLNIAGRGDFRAMPAYLRDDREAAGIKWVNVHPGNLGGPLPTVMGVLLYSNPATGFPLAIMDATYITQIRTGAAGGIAAKYLSRAGSNVVTLAGCGAQAATQLQAVAEVRDITRVLAYDLRLEAAETFARRAANLGFEAQAVTDLAAAVSEADILVTTTPSRTPIIKAAWLKPGCHVNAIGADAPGKQELEPEALRRAKVFIDDWEQASHSGEINVPVAQGLFTRDQLRGTLGEVVAGIKPGRENDTDITLFDSTGLALQDIATARYVYDECQRLNLGQETKLI
ncbi:MAG: alanine dehydrogenase [FCB group bacterium]|jgi:alanine dehydrogenase|nr:alanine dehydrogenase [FCB group bacterium]